MLICLVRTEQKFLNCGVQFCQAMLLVCEGVVNSHVSSRRHNVELRVEDVDAVHNSVEARHRERLMALILSNSLCATSNLLVRAGDDEVGVIHCN